MAADATDYKKQTIEAYDALAAELVQDYEWYFATFAHREADLLLAELDPGALVLDLGCGAGVASRYFVERGLNAVSGDLSEAMVRECQRRGLESVVRLDLERLPFRRTAFDGAWAHTSLIHVPKAKLTAALKEIAQRLKPGGVLFVALQAGGGEGYEGQTSTERWFSRFQEGEFETYVPENLTVTNSNHIELERHLFLNYHLAKKGTQINADAAPTERALILF
jgi:SAM-dependent methyltransferase